MALRIDSIDIFPREAHVRVSLWPALPNVVSPACAHYILERYPQLANHACFSGGAHVFGQVIRGTSLPHVLEHLVIHEQLLQGANAPCGAEAVPRMPLQAAETMPHVAPQTPVELQTPLPVAATIPQAPPLATQPSPQLLRESQTPPITSRIVPCTAKRLVGCTTWTNDEHTRALIRVMFYDDLVFLRALRTQTAFLNSAVQQFS